MSVRHIALAVLAVLVMGMCVFLFFEVRSSPAAPTVRSSAHREAGGDRDDEREPAVVTAKADGSQPYSGGLRSAARRAAGGDAASPGTPAAPSAPVTEEAGGDGTLEGPKLDAVMAEANRAYDKMEFDEARSIAQKVLKQHPANTRMLRIMTSSYCIESDAAEAQKWFNLLPAADREQMKTRCVRYNVTFTEPPAK